MNLRNSLAGLTLLLAASVSWASDPQGTNGSSSWSIPADGGTTLVLNGSTGGPTYTVENDGRSPITVTIVDNATGNPVTEPTSVPKGSCITTSLGAGQSLQIDDGSTGTNSGAHGTLYWDFP